ncbi:MAG: hypothetical protein RIS17_1901 [Pseudomonadota bacterium]
MLGFNVGAHKATAHPGRCVTVGAYASSKAQRVISDRTDWDELTATITELNPAELWVTHGREGALVQPPPAARAGAGTGGA